MAARPELLIFDCRKEDLEVLQSASGPQGPLLRVVSDAAECARDAITRDPAALVIGVGMGTLSRLDVLSVIRAVRKELPVIVVGEEDSLDLERSARQKDIFYYLVHPVDRSEAAAILQDVMRLTRGDS
jgi:DNA-binding NtrC family response regulator